MNKYKLFLVIIVLLILVQTAFSQTKLSGKVIEVIDGKTAVVQIGTSGNLKVVLQYVEIPEPEQPLHAVVKDHLEKLLLGKNALVLPRGIIESSTVAQVFVGGVDVSQQMIRDGAAWFALPEKTKKSGAETEVYLSNEAQAREEKRGVWSIKDLKPAWQFRAEKRERERAAELARLEEIKKQNQEKYQTVTKEKLPPPSAAFSNFEMWNSGRTATMWDDLQFYMQERVYNESGLVVGKAPKHNLSFILTKDVALNLSGGKTNPKIVCGAAYISRKAEKEGGGKEFFGIGCKSEAEKESFKTSNNLILTLDGKTKNFGKAIQLGRQSDKRFDEMLVFVLDREAFIKIAAAKNAQIKIGDFSGAMPSNFHSMIKNLVIESTKKEEKPAK
jgi:endonuclease YncB( thermonuclease family)